MRPHIATVLAAAGSTTVVLAAQAPSTATTAAQNAPQHAGVCAGVTKCQRVATIDVDGDRRADRVGWRRLGKKYAQVRVRTATGTLLKRRVDVGSWPGGGRWGDAAWIDGRRGAELLVGSVMGAHTPQYTMLTYRKGRLVKERSPSGGAVEGRWTVDSALMVHAGWQRRVGPRGRVTMSYTDAWRQGGSQRFRGSRVRYAWVRGKWKRVGRAGVVYRTERRARLAGGWHVGHLDRWPGLNR